MTVSLLCRMLLSRTLNLLLVAGEFGWATSEPAVLFQAWNGGSWLLSSVLLRGLRLPDGLSYVASFPLLGWKLLFKPLSLNSEKVVEL